MPGSALKKCCSCNVHISVACKTCKYCGQKQEMKKAIKVAKQKINERWVKNMKVANNFCKLINSANILMHKIHALGRYPILLLGKRNVSGSFSTDVITDTSFSSPEEKLSIETMKNIFSTLLKVKYSGRDNEFESNQSMSPSEEDCGVSNEVDATVFHKGDGPSTRTDREDVVTLTLTPVDLSHEPSHICQPPIKKKILENSRSPENSSAAIQISASAASVHHLPVSKSNKFRYKIKDCPVHLHKQHFPFVKTMGTRIAKNGEKETKLRWQPCSGCGVKWKDTWEPYERFPSD